MDKGHHIEELIKEQFSGKKMNPSSNLFEKIEREYQRKRRRKFGFLIFSIFITISSLAVIFNYNNNGTEIAEKADKTTEEKSVVTTQESNNSSFNNSRNQNHKFNTQNESKIQNAPSNKSTGFSSTAKESQSIYSNFSNKESERGNSINENKTKDTQFTKSENQNRTNNLNPSEKETNESNISIAFKAPLHPYFPDSSKKISLILKDKIAFVKNTFKNEAKCCESCIDTTKDPLFFMGTAYHFIQLKTEEMYLMKYAPKASGSFQIGFRKSLLKRQIIPNIAFEISYFQNYLKYESFYKDYYDAQGKYLGGGGNFARIEYRDQLNFSIPMGLDFRAVKLGRFNLLLGGGFKYTFVKNYHAIDLTSGPYAYLGKVKISGKDYVDHYSAFYAKAELEYITSKYHFSVFTNFHQKALLFKTMHMGVDEETIKIGNTQLGVKFSF